MKWRNLAACLDAPRNVFFVERGESSKPARAICAECPVVTQCRDYAIDTRQEFGVWGGMTVRQLREERRRRAKKPKHGYSTYRRHGCRCDICELGKQRHHRMVTARRQQKRKEQEGPR